MAFIIDRDHLAEGEPGTNANATGRVFPPTFTDAARLIHKFRLLDDDNEVYYTGRSTSDSSFAPLDWGQWNAGCTSIQYRNDGKWETL